jgi:hypothetical protein
MYGFLPTTDPEHWGYNNTSATNVLRLTRIALDRENRLNTEESKQYMRTATELEFGAGFFERAHP